MVIAESGDPMLDRLITGARVFDGSRFLERANVGIAGDQIA
jgi:hypothetical protein